MLKEAGESIERFLDSGVTELGDKLGPLLWQFAPFKKFDEADFGGFLELLPATFDGRSLRHVIEVRHDSFKTPAFIALLRKFGIAAVYTDHVTYPNIADVTGDFVYARLQQGEDDVPTAYPPKEIGDWAERLKPGRTARSRPTCRGSTPSTSRRPRRAMCLPMSSTRASARAGGRHGADRTAEGLSDAPKPRPQAQAKSAKLFTIGYEQAKPDAVMAELKRAKVKLLVDTRAVAASRKPGFSKRQLAATLDENGIAYLHLQKLGTPDEGRQAARAGKLDTLWRIYAKHLKTPEAIEAMDELIAIVKSGQAGVPALLRARQGLLPPQPHRRDRHERTGASVVDLAPPLF